jgi:hypothetical protein
MKKITLVIFVTFFFQKSYSQVISLNSAWIREDFINSIDKINDTIPCRNYTFPILGFSNIFKTKMGVMAYHSDEMQIPKSSYILINKSTIKINNYIGGFLTDKFLAENRAKNDKSLYGVLTLKNDKLLLQLTYKGKVFKEYYFINHYKNYFFSNLRESYTYLYSLKYPKK